MPRPQRAQMLCPQQAQTLCPAYFAYFVEVVTRVALSVPLYC